MKRLFLVLLLSISMPVMAMGKAPTEVEKSAFRSSVAACEIVVQELNRKELSGQINEPQLVEILQNLNTRQRLPAYFVMKQQAREQGWRPGIYFQDIPSLTGKSMGGDRFGNYERRLPKGSWKEADLDYLGKKRNAKRLVYSPDGQQRYVTVDHYETFHKVPSCQ
ncbi:ribonuclease domain-containing protein [Advenella sp. RU8]|uniref:ribonuclease domain-containing protein n=1 Tax=Advenella sp. RU8 TaxID=3399575 RepID=UPI003AABB32D